MSDKAINSNHSSQKRKVINLIRERQIENEFWVDSFEITGNDVNPEQALRNAVAEFLSTDAGKREVEQTCYDFNWGDAIMTVPDEIWRKHGLSLFKGSVITRDIHVDQDEVLCADESVNDNSRYQNAEVLTGETKSCPSYQKGICAETNQLCDFCLNNGLQEKESVAPGDQSCTQPAPEDNKKIYLFYSCNQWKEYSSMKLIMASSDKSKIIEQIEVELLANNMEYAGADGKDGVLEFRAREYDFNLLGYGFVDVVGDGEVQ